MPRHMADLRVRVTATGLATYPDITVICGAWARDPEDKKTIINPTVIIEVLSPTTEEYDRGEKFEHYKQLDSLREYVIVAHSRREVEVMSRGENGLWERTIHGSGSVAPLRSISGSIDVDGAYDDAAEPRCRGAGTQPRLARRSHVNDRARSASAASSSGIDILPKRWSAARSLVLCMQRSS